jgi:catechol 2,3-dioxygenase
MTDRPIATLRSVDMVLPDVAAAERFYTEVWRLDVAARAGDSVWLRGSGADHHLLALHPGPQAALRGVSFRVRADASLDAIAARVAPAGGRVLRARHALDEPGGGQALLIRDPQGRVLRLVQGDETRAPTQPTPADQPQRLAHVVFNSSDVAVAQAFYEQALGLRLSDRTRMMAFMRLPQPGLGDHHSIALADADNDCLNHVAFVMPDLDAVMRGGGRMKDAGHAIEWGPGRHGPGDNAFNYFIGPANFVIEYTAVVEQVDDSYRVGAPTDWTWPPGRVDHWGISAAPSARLKAAQRAIRFIDNDSLEIAS